MNSSTTNSVSPIQVGISACLLGHKVRFNGGHKRSSFCLNQLSRIFNYVPICPEVGIGMGVPREPIRLVGNPEQPRAIGSVNPDLDVTEALQEYGAKQAKQLQHLSGYILMQKSPSCGMERVKVYQSNGYPHRNSGTGLYAQQIMKHLPLMPVEEEGRLHDPILRENFINRVIAYHSWQQLMQELTPSALIQFHTRYKYSVLAHSPKDYSHLGQLVANIDSSNVAETANTYQHIFMKALQQRATRKTHSNVLMHILGFLKHALLQAERGEILYIIHQYRQGFLPLIVPITLLKHFIKQHGNTFIQQQMYLSPYPDELGLRNAI
ncbi:YbgA family protein [Zooshikella ganghwensis]|uniref:DUF1722 domain-containing protein n=1 Tax=Zooshikella ganghwensis TaxID=202772 RepID=A0A4P9VJC1_9GAMM|nr:DUF523 and DUF1722 domain-containing protein [Zooshikella ganghwensis]RDH43323.1 DUF1722 domain-containing protein [Zooshikella ganghwensis]